MYVYGESETYRFVVSQISSLDVDSWMIPICEPITFHQSADKTEYEVYEEDGDEPIYTGCAYKYPDNDEIVIELNDIISSYLKNDIVFKRGLHKMNDFIKTFVVSGTLGNDQTVTSYNS